MGIYFLNKKKNEPEKVTGLLKELPQIKAPDDFEFRLQCRLESLSQSKTVNEKKEIFSFLTYRRWIPASAFVLMFAAALTIFLRNNGNVSSGVKPPVISQPIPAKIENQKVKSGIKPLTMPAQNIAVKKVYPQNAESTLQDVRKSSVSGYRARLQEDIANIKYRRDNDVDKSLRKLPSAGNVSRGYDDRQTVNFGNEADEGQGGSSSRYNEDSARILNDNK
jgi:hypothetical protein